MNDVAEPVSPPATMPRQRSKPLLPVRGVVSILDRNEDQVLALIEDGSLAWAWDVALNPRSSHSRELRVLPAAVAAYLRGDAGSFDWPDVFSLLVPNTPTVLAREVSRVLNVSSTHVYALIRGRRLASCSAPKTGPLGSARIPTDSFAEFLKNRRFP